MSDPDLVHRTSSEVERNSVVLSENERRANWHRSQTATELARVVSAAVQSENLSVQQDATIVLDIDMLSKLCILLSLVCIMIWSIVFFRCNDCVIETWDIPLHAFLLWVTIMLVAFPVFKIYHRLATKLLYFMWSETQWGAKVFKHFVVHASGHIQLHHACYALFMLLTERHALSHFANTEASLQSLDNIIVAVNIFAWVISFIVLGMTYLVSANYVSSEVHTLPKLLRIHKLLETVLQERMFNIPLLSLFFSSKRNHLSYSDTDMNVSAVLRAWKTDSSTYTISESNLTDVVESISSRIALNVIGEMQKDGDPEELKITLADLNNTFGDSHQDSWNDFFQFNTETGLDTLAPRFKKIDYKLIKRSVRDYILKLLRFDSTLKGASTILSSMCTVGLFFVLMFSPLVFLPIFVTNDPLVVITSTFSIAAPIVFLSAQNIRDVNGFVQLVLFYDMFAEGDLLIIDGKRFTVCRICLMTTVMDDAWGYRIRMPNHILTQKIILNATRSDPQWSACHLYLHPETNRKEFQSLKQAYQEIAERHLLDKCVQSYMFVAVGCDEYGRFKVAMWSHMMCNTEDFLGWFEGKSKIASCLAEAATRSHCRCIIFNTESEQGHRPSSSSAFPAPFTEL